MRRLILASLAAVALGSPAFSKPAPADAESSALSQPVRATTTLPSLFTDADYPVAAIRAREQGSVDFQLLVNARGRVTACNILRSSGSALLDATTCRLVQKRGRFIPARDKKGRPAPDTIAGRVNWRLPGLTPAAN